MIHRLFSILAFFVSCACAFGQDIHFSQFYMTPTLTNPAFTGNFEGTYRLNGVLRRQWSAISSQPFETVGSGVDWNAPFNITGTGLGLQISQDRSGLSAFSTFQANASAAASVRFTSDKSWKIGIGAAYGYESQSVDFSRLKFDRQFNGKFFDPNLPTLEFASQQSFNRTHLSGGGYLSKSWSSRTNATVGYSIFNLMQQDQGGSAFYENFTRHSIQLLSSLEVFDFMDLTPTVQYMWQGPQNQILAGTGATFYLKRTYQSTQAILVGSHLRWADAAIFSLGFRQNNLILNASYDVNYSDLRVASDLRGGWEVALIYTIETVRENVKRKVQCPNYF